MDSRKLEETGDVLRKICQKQSIPDYSQNYKIFTELTYFQITVMLKDENDFSILHKAVASYDIDTIERSEFNSRRCLLMVNYFSDKSALQIANELHETGIFQFAIPNVLLFIRYY